MSEYMVHMVGYISGGIRVEAEDPDGAIDEAMTEGLRPICAKCSGWGADQWFKEEGDEWTEVSVCDADGKEVWAGPDHFDQRVTMELVRLAGLINAAPDIARAVEIVRERIIEIEGTR